MTGAELEAEFQAKALRYAGGLLVLRPEDATALIRRAAELRIGILGVDGMFVRPGETVSPIDHIVDFSAANAQGDGCWAAAEKFVGLRTELGLVFEVTLGQHLDDAV